MKLFICIIIFNYLCFVSLKKIILLPYNSELCQKAENDTKYGKYYAYRDFKLEKQINIATTPDINYAWNMIQNETYIRALQFNQYPWIPLTPNEDLIHFACRIMVKPFGIPIKNHVIQGEYNFWSIRARISVPRFDGKCFGNIIFQFRHRDNTVSDFKAHSAQEYAITCNDNLPLFINSTYKKLYISYHLPKFKSLDDTQTSSISSPTSYNGFIMNITSFIYFNGAFTREYQRDFCSRQDGFWCSGKLKTSETPDQPTCIYREMVCDGHDSCFDGGSDEKICNKIKNMTIISDNLNINGSFSGDNRGQMDGLMEYLPWLALGILPLILLMALLCICNQQRSDAYFEDNPLDGPGMIDEEVAIGEGYFGAVDGDGCVDEETSQMVGGFYGSGDEFLDEEDEDDEKKWTGINVTNEPESEKSLVNNGTNGLPMKNLHIESSPTNDLNVTKADINTSFTQNSLSNHNYEDVDSAIKACENNDDDEDDGNGSSLGPLAPSAAAISQWTSPNNIMTQSQMTEDEYDDHLIDVNSLLRKIDNSKLSPHIRTQIEHKSNLDEEKQESTDPNDKNVGTYDYRSDYILV